MTDRRLVLIGVDSDPTFVHLAVEARLADLELDLIDLREIAQEGRWRFAVPEDGSSFVSGPSGDVELGMAAAVFARPIDLSSTQDGWRRRRWRGLMEGLRAWLETTPALVINRPHAHEHNGSKPYHEQWLASRGFDVPPAVTTSDRQVLDDFVSSGPAIMKTLSGVRATARVVTAEDLRDFHPEQGPVHVQRLVTGADVRAHVVGDVVIAAKIESDAVDYRMGGRNRWSTHELSDGIRAMVVSASRAMGLSLSGWDFKLDSEARLWCLEANPMPGYSSYDRHAEGAISRAIFGLMQNQADSSVTAHRGWRVDESRLVS